MVITSTSNPQVKNLIQLRKKAKIRDEQDVFVAEGIKMYEEAPAEHLVQTFMSETFFHKYGAGSAAFRHNDEAKTGAGITILSDSVFASVSDTATPQGVLCVVRQYHYRPDDLLRSAGGFGEKGRVTAQNRQPLLIVLENLQDPGNLGTILRTAEGAGVTGVLLTGGCVDIYNPKVIRSTMGSIYRMPFCYTDDLPAAVQSLQSQGIRFYAAHLRGAVSYEKPDYTGPSAFLIGNESRGLSDTAADAADLCVKIPMCGQVESLNAGIAAAVLMYEAARQRR